MASWQSGSCWEMASGRRIGGRAGVDGAWREPSWTGVGQMSDGHGGGEGWRGCCVADESEDCWKGERCVSRPW